MRRIFTITILLIGLNVPSAESAPTFLSGTVRSATNIAFPINSTVTGIVSFMVAIDGTGQFQNLTVVRDIPSLTSVASAAVQGWSFTPARLDVQPVASIVPTSVVFNPFNPAGVGSISLSIPLSPAPPGPSSGYAPAQITSASFATYPVASLTSGAVVLDVTIGSEGMVMKIHAIRDVKPLTAQAIKAVKKWTFSPATFQGDPIVSHVVIAFVFPSPGSGSF
jgi:Gram-negative bacterial TonB protein C-terminal